MKDFAYAERLLMQKCNKFKQFVPALGPSASRVAVGGSEAAAVLYKGSMFMNSSRSVVNPAVNTSFNFASMSSACR